MGLSARDTLSKQSLTRLSLVKNTHQKTSGETANHKETAGIRTLQGEGGPLSVSALSALRDLDCSEERFTCSLGSAHWVSPENTSAEQPMLPTGRQERIPQAMALKMVLKGKSSHFQVCSETGGHGRFLGELEEGTL